MSGPKGLAIFVLAWLVLASGPDLASGQDSKAAEKAAKEKSRSDSDAISLQAGATDPSGHSKLLSDKGLTKKDRQFVLDETAAIEKFNQAMSLRLDFQKALQHSTRIANFDAQIQQMNAQVQALQQQLSEVQSQMNHSVPSASGARRTQRLIDLQQAPLRAQQQAAKAEIGRINSQLKAANAKPPKKDERTLASSEFDRTRQAYVAAAVKLNALVSPLIAKYHELAKDKAVIQALEKVSHDEKKTYKLGPSAEVASAVKLIAEVKKSLPPSSKASAKSSAKAKAKSSPTPF